ncbi:hypothetical protein B0T09DRAFT_179363 [Sordaria sp. MPI-SDFR-AT-0083]|nr:hypothetical protein B0T09DRAFT_179363 [Sordaria sp. MPI-SDFR-AT-0083]
MVSRTSHMVLLCLQPTAMSWNDIAKTIYWQMRISRRPSACQGRSTSNIYQAANSRLSVSLSSGLLNQNQLLDDNDNE